MHEPGSTRVELEIRIFEQDKLAFSFRQFATYSSAAKALILEVAALDAGKFPSGK